jgi:hypothetical protein
MRAPLSFLWTIGFLAAAIPAAAQDTKQIPVADWLPPSIANSNIGTEDIDAPCRIPFEKLKDVKTNDVFPLNAARNDNDKLPDYLRNRYIVADFNSADENGVCRGVQEHFSRVDDLSEFPRLRAIAAARDTDLITLAKENPQVILASIGKPEEAAVLAIEIEDLKNYVEQVHKFKTDPINKAGVFTGYCVGQTLNYCEIVDGKPKLVYRFVTSSSRWHQKPNNNYYAPINYIAKRNWSTDRRYTPADAKRDERMGGGVAHIAMFENGGRPIEMPNFLHFLPANGYKGERANGIHQIAGGLDSGGTFGSPVSLGCVRLSRYAAKLSRWWTPQNAKFFIYLTDTGYRNLGDIKTGKAKPYWNPPPVETRAPEQRAQDFGFNPFPFFSR